MTPPELTLTQGQEYDDHIKKGGEHINSTKIFLLDVKSTQEDTRNREIKKLTKSLKKLDYKVALINADLCGWKARIIQHLLDE